MMKIKINQYVFTAKVVDDPENIALGMMGKTFDRTFNAMLFLLEKREPVPYSPNHYLNLNEKKETCFWMKNCIIPLDMIFIKDNKITKIHHSCPPCTSQNTPNCKNYCGVGTMVIEVNGGTCKQLHIAEENLVDFLQ
jgi:uncharacterized membrane protein (UPF0127 family)